MQRLAMAAAGLRHKRRAGFLVRTEQALIVRPDIFIALAGPLPDPFQIDDMNAAPVIGDHPGLLQLARNRRDSGTADTHHLREKFLCQRKIDANEIVHAEQPLAGPSLNVMDRIAGCRLLHLRQKELFVVDQQTFESRKFIS